MISYAPCVKHNFLSVVSKGAEQHGIATVLPETVG